MSTSGIGPGFVAKPLTAFVAANNGGASAAGNNPAQPRMMPAANQIPGLANMIPGNDNERSFMGIG